MAALPKVTLVPAGSGTYCDYVNCAGEITPLKKYEVYCSIPVYATKVEASLGERVKKGQALAVLDVELSRSISSSSAGAKTPSAAQDYSDILSMYGIDSKTAAGIAGDYSVNSGVDAQKVEYPQYDVPSVLISPADGIITEINISESVLTDNSQPLFVLADDSAYGVRLSAGEADISKVSVGDRVDITGSGFEGVYTAYVTKIYPTAKKKLSGTTYETVVDIDAALMDRPEAIKIGFSAKGKIYISKPTYMVLVPYSAVRQDSDNAEYVYVYSGGKVRRRDILTGEELLESVQVISGLSEGESVVTNPDSVYSDEEIGIIKAE